MYEEHVLKHYGEPYHKDRPPQLGSFHRLFIERKESTVCGDDITLWIRVLANGLIHSIWWEGEGCCFSQAAASMLAEYFEGKPLNTVHAFTKAEMLELFAAEVPKAREGCVTLALTALKKLPEKL